MRKFKVLLVVPLAGIGGTELSTLALATGLKQAGHQVYVMCNDSPLLEEFTKRGLEVVLVGMQRNPIALIRDASRMRRFIADNKIEVIHFQSALPIIMSLLAWRTIKANRVKVVWTCRSVKKTTYLILGRLFNHLVDVVIGNCKTERDKLIRYGFPPAKVTYAYNPPTIAIPEEVDGKDADLLNELGINPETPVVGTASRLSPERGVNYFVEAAAIIAQQIPNVRFVIAGGGPMDQPLRQRVNALNIEQQVIFLGPRRDMERVYSIMDVFVNPRRYDYEAAGTGNTNAEAMAFAKPIVATNVAGFAEIVQDRVTGILVPPGDSERLAQAILDLLSDKEWAMVLGLAGRQRVLTDFTVERLVHDVVEVYGTPRGHGV